MTKTEQVSALRTMTKETDETILSTYLEIAGERILQRAYPFKRDFEGVEVPRKYRGLQIEISAYLLNKRGAEGQNYHSENGINRTYESASVPESMLKSVTPKLGVI